MRRTFCGSQWGRTSSEWNRKLPRPAGAFYMHHSLPRLRTKPRIPHVDRQWGRKPLEDYACNSDQDKKYKTEWNFSPLHIIRSSFERSNSNKPETVQASMELFKRAWNCPNEREMVQTSAGQFKCGRTQTYQETTDLIQLVNVSCNISCAISRRSLFLAVVAAA